MSTKKQLELEMLRAEAAANRRMREATAHMDDQALWEGWQAAEQRAKEARQRWRAACEVELQHAA